MFLSSNIQPCTANLTGTQYSQQSYKVSDSFPFKWINKKWREGFHVTSMATAGSRWGVVMSRNAGFSDQVNLNPSLYQFSLLLPLRCFQFFHMVYVCPLHVAPNFRPLCHYTAILVWSFYSSLLNIFSHCNPKCSWS